MSAAVCYFLVYFSEALILLQYSSNVFEYKISSIKRYILLTILFIPIYFISFAHIALLNTALFFVATFVFLKISTMENSATLFFHSAIMIVIMTLCELASMGIFSKFWDFRQAQLPGVLMAIDGALDIHNFLGRFAIWVLIALCISIYSNSAIRASINVFVFFVGMVASYYLYSNYIAGFFPRSYAMIWFGFTAVSPLLAFVCWYAKGKSRPAFMLSVLILAVLFNMTFVYGWGYFEARSVLELIVFIIGLTVLRSDTLKSSVLMGTISIVLAVLLDMVIPFHFG